MSQIETAVDWRVNSTGNLMKDMVLKGPSTYDGIFVYESVAIDYLGPAKGAGTRSTWSIPSTTCGTTIPTTFWTCPGAAEHRRAAKVFQDFLLSEAVQRKAMDHGFRPANPQVPVKFPESPFTIYASYGLRPDLGTMCDPPKADVVTNLLQSWQRSHGER